MEREEDERKKEVITSLETWLISDCGIHKYAAPKIASTLFTANILTPARLVWRLDSSPTLLLDLKIDKYDADDILAGVKP